jgi:hypothetical protein
MGPTIGSADGGGLWSGFRPFDSRSEHIWNKYGPDRVSRDEAETKVLTSIRGMKRSIQKGMKTPLKECHQGPCWEHLAVQRKPSSRNKARRER